MSRGGGGTVNVYLTNQGVLGSEREVLAWLKNSVDKYRRSNGRDPF